MGVVTEFFLKDFTFNDLRGGSQSLPQPLMVPLNHDISRVYCALVSLTGLVIS